MLKRELIQTIEVPGGRSKMSLQKQGPEYSIWVDGVPLMTTRKHGSEEALADLGCAHLDGATGGQILVGGLGMGFTLAATLKIAGPEAKVVVAELVPAVHEWNRDLLGEFAGLPLRDPRVVVEIADVADVLRRSPNTFDAILLDVDNGPSGMTQDSNNWLYGNDGLNTIFKSLRKSGAVAIWSAYSDPIFLKRLQKQNAQVMEHAVRARSNGSGTKHVVWVAQKR